MVVERALELAPSALSASGCDRSTSEASMPKPGDSGANFSMAAPPESAALSDWTSAPREENDRCDAIVASAPGMNLSRRLLSTAPLVSAGRMRGAGPLRREARAPGRRDRCEIARDRAATRAATPVARHRVVQSHGTRPTASLRPARTGRRRLCDRPLPIGHGPDDLAAVHRRADDRSARPDAGRARARSRHGLGLPGGGAAECVAKVYTIEIVAPLGEKARDAARRRSAIATSTCASATATRAGPRRRRSTRSSSPRRPTTSRSRSSISWRRGGRMVIPVGSALRRAGVARDHQGCRRPHGHAQDDGGPLRAAHARS